MSDYVIDYTTVWGIAPTVQNYILPGDIDTPADNWQDGSQTGGLDIQEMLAELNDGFNTLRKNGVYIFVYDYLNNILAVNGKTGTPADTAKAAAQENPNVCINDLINHFLGREVDNSHIIGVGDNNHKLEAYAKSGVGIGEAGAGDVSVANFGNSDIMVISPGYFQQKHIYTDRGQRVEQKTDTFDHQNGNGGNIKLLYVHEDVMGNTRYHTKDDGQSYAELEYDIWGNPTSPNMLLNNDNGVFIFAQFTGHIYDTVLDIYFAEARFLDAKNRQWLNSDPMKDGLNWYQYVRANPVTFVDSSGLFVRIKDDRTKKEVIDKWGKYMADEDKDRLEREGILHFDETKVDSHLTGLRIYRDSISETDNYIYLASRDPRVYKEYMGEYPSSNFEYPFFIIRKMDAKQYYVDRESRLYFLKHFARVQSLKHIKQDPSYFSNLTCDPITDAEAFKNIAQYAVDLNAYIIDDSRLNHQILDDLLHTIGSSQYIVNKIEGEFVNGQSIYQLLLRTFGQTGFSKDLQEDFGDIDPDPNNVQHHLLAIYLGYYYGSWSAIPAWAHEYADIRPGQAPGTDQDWESSLRGIALGILLKEGKIDMKDLATYIYYNITYEN